MDGEEITDATVTAYGPEHEVLKGDRMYEAMTSRCFNGKLRFEKSPKMTQWDFFKTAISVVIIVVLIVIEKGYVV